MRSTALIFHTLLSLVSVTSAPRAEPSFECSEAARPDERAICNDEDLAERDELAGQIFAMLSRKPATAAAGIEESRRFIGARRVCGSEIDCIRREQNALLDALIRIAAPEPQPVIAPIGPIVSQESELFGRYSGTIFGILLFAAFAWFTRFAIRALLRGRQIRARRDQAIRQDPEQPLEIEVARAAPPSAASGWLARIAASWLRYKTNASNNRAIREVRREHRRPTRFRQGKLFDVHGVFLSQCTICDRSKNGARIKVDKPLQPLEAVRFLDEVEKIIVESKVAWQRGNELGLAFQATARSAEISVVHTGVLPVGAIRSRSI